MRFLLRRSQHGFGGVCCEQSLIRSQPWQVGASSSCLSCCGTWRWYFAGHSPAALVGVPVQDSAGVGCASSLFLPLVLSSGEHGCVGGVWREPMLPGDLFPNEALAGKARTTSSAFYTPRGLRDLSG